MLGKIECGTGEQSVEEETDDFIISFPFLIRLKYKSVYLL
jgi:hypothetical protein